MKTVKEFMERFEKACNFSRPVDNAAIENALLRFAKNITEHPVKVVFLTSAQALVESGKAARDARDARDAWAAWAAWDARDAWDAWAARAARDAWDAWAARAARDARDARDAWDAWDAWDAAWDVSYMSCAIAGAIAREDNSFVEKWTPFFEALESGAWNLLWTADTVYVMTLPSVKRIAPQRLHCVDGPAFQWCDMELYYLNGILVEPWMVMTPVAELVADPKRVLNITNVDQRTETIGRIGMQNFIDHMPHKIRDEEGFYKLYEVDIDAENKGCLYLKMKNPSTGEWHLEAVSNDCKTVQHANNWRVYEDINKLWCPSQLT